MKEREISLIDLLTEILLRWRGIVIMMLAGIILFGVFSFVQTYRASKAQEAEVKAAQEEIVRKEAEREAEELEQQKEREELERMTLEEQLGEELTELQMREVRYAITYETMYNDKLAYREQSLMMQLDPNNVKKVELTFYVSSDDRQRSHDIEKVYEDIVRSGEAIEYIAKQIGCDAANINEGISLGRGSSGLLEDTNTFRVSILHYNKSDCKRMAQALTEFVDSKYDELSETMGRHEITLTNQSFSVTTEPSVLSHQRSYLSDLDSLENTIVNAKSRFTFDQWDYYDFLVNGKLTGISEEKKEKAEADEAKEQEDEEDDEETETPEAIMERGVTVTPRVSMKYVVLGAVLMAFLYVFVIFVIYVLNNRLRTTDSLQDMYEIPQLGMIPGQEKSKKPFAFIDEWILSLRDRNKRKFTKVEAVELSVVAVKMAVGKAELDRICLIGCDLKQQSLEICDAIQEKLSGDNVRVSVLNNVLYDAQAMSELEGEKGVVLVERAGATLYTEIAQELELLNRQGIKVLGGIVVE